MQAQPSPETQTPPSIPRTPAGGAKAGLGTILGSVALVVAVAALALHFVVPGPTGPTGASYTTNSVLQSGQTETGLFSAMGGNATGYFGDTINFRIPLSVDLPSSNATYITYGGTYTVSCPGPDHALPGHLCVYEENELNRLAPGSLFYAGPILNPWYGGTNVSRWGFAVYYIGTASASFAYGTWTVAAP